MKVTRGRTTVRRLNIRVAVALLLSLAGCDPYYVSSAHGLVGRAEPFDAKFLGEYYGPTWERVEWKIERLMDTDTYFLTQFGSKGEKKFFTASVMKVGDLKLMDLQEAPAEGRPARPHLLMKIDRTLTVALVVGANNSYPAKKIAALGGGPLIRHKTLTLKPPRSRYFLDHPGLVTTQGTIDEKGNTTGLMLIATSNELSEFFSAHGADKGLWADDEKAVKLGGKLAPGER